MVGTGELVVRAVSAVRVARRTAELVRQVVAVLVPVTLELGLDAVAGVASKLVRRTLEVSTFRLVAAVAAVIVMVASPPRRNTLVVAASELGLGTFSIFAGTHCLVFVRVVATVVLKVAEPSLRNASVVSALEVSLLLALGAGLRLLVTVVPAVVLAVAVQPLGNTPVVGLSRALPPAGRTVALSAQEGRLVRVVATVVVKIAVPQLGNTFSIFAGKLCCRVAGSVVTDFLGLVATIDTVIVTIALPGSQDTLSRLLAFEFSFRAFMITVFLVAQVTTIISSIADCHDQCTAAILTLKLSVFADSRRTCTGLVRTIGTVGSSITFPVVRNTFLITSSAMMLPLSTARNTGFLIIGI